MAISSTQALRLIEARTEGAIVQELRIMMQQVVSIRPLLSTENQAYADRLVLKMNRMIDDQLAQPVRGDLPTAGTPLPEEAESSPVAAYPVEAALA